MLFNWQVFFFGGVLGLSEALKAQSSKLKFPPKASCEVRRYLIGTKRAARLQLPGVDGSIRLTDWMVGDVIGTAAAQLRTFEQNSNLRASPAHPHFFTHSQALLRETAAS